MATPGDGGNGRVTYGRLLERMDNALESMERLTVRIDGYIESTDERIGHLEAKQAAFEVELTNTKASVRQWNIANSLGAAIALISAWLKGLI
jgi:hypothetical protein